MDDLQDISRDMLKVELGAYEQLESNHPEVYLYVTKLVSIIPEKIQASINHYRII